LSRAGFWRKLSTRILPHIPAGGTQAAIFIWEKRLHTMSLAIFDLDNTLLAGDSDHRWGEFLCEKIGHRRMTIGFAMINFMRTIEPAPSICMPT
jgi:hypothetical protein